jgi:hypothetical protein
MTREQAIQRVSYHFKKDMKKRFDELEWQAAIKDKSFFYIYNTFLNHGVKITVTTEYNELKYDVSLINRS